MPLNRLNAVSALRNLYAELPEMPSCPDGCCKCCGPVTFSKVEAELAGVPGARMYSLGKGPYGDTCEFVDDDTGKCKIYEHRPFICRLFNGSYERAFACAEIAEHGTMTDARSLQLIGRYCQIIEEDEDCLAEYLSAVDRTWSRMKNREKRNGWSKEAVTT